LTNPAFYTSIILFILSLFPILLYLQNNKYINKNLDEIIYTDSKGFEPKKMKAIYYFGHNEEENEMEEHKDTTRELKNHKRIENDNNILNLKENEVKEVKAEAKTETKTDVNCIEQNIKKNNFINEQDEQQPRKTTPKQIRIISSEDYKNLPIDKLFCDKRTFAVMLKEYLKTEHTLFSLFLKRSLFEPFFLRLCKFVFEINIQLAFNALLYNDSYIDQRLDNPDVVI
jgi:hypothetical protein